MTNPDILREVEQARRRYGIVGTDAALQAAIERSVRVAPIDLTVLVSGESGTGKEFFPHIIHDFSARKHNRYIAVNCGAIPEGTIDSELFGHEKGSFTGAISSRKGYFEEANGGTIFLDEVAELPLTTQARLLRVLETGEFLKVGSSEVQKTDIRVVAATNVDLPKAVREGKFREDLYYRLSTVQINVPALRYRGNDVLLLARLFASKFAERYNIPPVTFNDDARRVMTSYRWPGNVRQLKNIVEQIALFEAGKEIDGTTMMRYLPDDRDMSFTPAHYRPDEAGRYEKEREMLLGMLFSLQNEVKDLKEMLGQRERADKVTPAVLLPTQQALRADSITDILPAPVDIVEVPTIVSPANTLEAHKDDAKASPETSADTPGTLRDIERETIRRALERNRGVRKSTANDLQISERTLYRKIKEFGIDEV